MSIHKSNSINISASLNGKGIDPWQNPFPNTPDFTFNYKKLMDNASPAIGVASEDSKDPRIVIIGAGIAGLTAARELVRCGYNSIMIIEATNRIGGRTYSRTYQNKPPTETKRYTCYEMGAMRFPFLAPPNDYSVMAHYAKAFGIKSAEFPDPGKVSTGIWINGGKGVPENPNPDPNFYLWKPTDSQPPTQQFQDVLKLWENFVKLTSGTVEAPGKFREMYNEGADAWSEYWTKVVKYYDAKDFASLVRSAPGLDPNNPGNLGGLGMTAEQARLFYTIGAGDGSWGAFFNISSLYPMRTLLFGFGDNHQLIYGNFDDNYNFVGDKKPLYNNSVKDSTGRTLQRPYYVGVQSFAENLFYEKFTKYDNTQTSLYEEVQKNSGVRLLTGKTALYSHKTGPRNLSLYVYDTGTDPKNASIINKCANLIVTPTTWATQLNSPKLADILPPNVWAGMKLSHWITSCKVFFPLKKMFWEDPSSVIPQVLVSDTFLQDSYGYAAERAQNNTDPGVYLATYSWEDDALKLIAGDEDELIYSVRTELSNIYNTAATTKGKENVVNYFDESEKPIIHWTKEPSYRGCAKLYRAQTEFLNYELLSYNQKHAKESNIYFAGEAYSVYGGWTEPAFRHAIDAVLNILHDTGSKITVKDFDFEKNYPKYKDPNPYK